MTLDAGAMDRRITLQQATRSQDADTGEEILTWAAVTDEVDSDGTIPAQWLPAGTRETWQAQQRLGGYVDGVFRIYDRTTRPTASDFRIVWEGAVYDIKPPVEIGRGDGLEIPVVAKVE